MTKTYFYLVCIILTSSLGAYCLYMYILNKSTSLVDFKPLGKRSDVDIYPSLSLCPYKVHFINESKLRENNISNAARDYKDFLYGSVWDLKMENIEYDDYTIDLNKFISKIGAIQRGTKVKALYEWTPNNTIIHGSDLGPEINPFYISYRSDKDKCYSLDIQDVIMNRLNVNTIRRISIEFQNLVVPGVGINVFLHYPKQLFHSLPTFNIGKLEALDTSHFWLDDIAINNMIVVRRRNTFTEPCDVDWKNIDYNILKHIASTVGCKPRHWKLEDRSIKLCNTKEEMKAALVPAAFNLDVDILENVPPPCQQLHVVIHDSKTTKRIEGCKLGYTCKLGKVNNKYNNESTNKVNTEITKVTRREMQLNFKLSYYEEIIHVRAFDTQNFIGNVGGYIGMFLGASLWQLPVFIKFISNSLSKWKTNPLE